MYRIIGDYEGESYFWEFIDFESIFKTKEKAMENLKRGIKEGLNTDSSLYTDLGLGKRKALDWWLENHFKIIAVKIK